LYSWGRREGAFKEVKKKLLGKERRSEKGLGREIWEREQKDGNWAEWTGTKSNTKRKPRLDTCLKRKPVKVLCSYEKKRKEVSCQFVIQPSGKTTRKGKGGIKKGRRTLTRGEK